MKIEYRVGWESFSNISFQGTSEWFKWDGFEETVEEVENILDSGNTLGIGLEAALEGSGFSYWTEVREVDDE